MLTQEYQNFPSFQTYFQSFNMCDNFRWNAHKLVAVHVNVFTKTFLITVQSNKPVIISSPEYHWKMGSRLRLDFISCLLIFCSQETGNSCDTEGDAEERNVPCSRYCVGQGRFWYGLNTWSGGVWPSGMRDVWWPRCVVFRYEGCLNNKVFDF